MSEFLIYILQYERSNIILLIIPENRKSSIPNNINHTSFLVSYHQPQIKSSYYSTAAVLLTLYSGEVVGKILVPLACQSISRRCITALVFPTQSICARISSLIHFRSSYYSHLEKAAQFINTFFLIPILVHFASRIFHNILHQEYFIT